MKHGEATSEVWGLAVPLQAGPEQRTQGHLQAHPATCLLGGTLTVARAASSHSCSHLCQVCGLDPVGMDSLWGRPKVGGEASQAKCFLLPWVWVAMGKELAGPMGGRGFHPQNQKSPLCQESGHQESSWRHARGPSRQQPLRALALARAHELTPRPESGGGPEPRPLPQTK